MSTEVVKVQRPLASSGGDRLWLISQEIKNLMSDRNKIYLLASWTGAGWVLLPQEQIGASW